MRTLLKDKLNNWLGYLLVGLLACLFGALEAVDITAGFLLFGVLLGLLLLTIFLNDPEACFYTFLFYGFWISFFNSSIFRLTFPIGVPYDALCFCLLLGLMISKPQIRTRWKSFISIPYVGYYFVIVFSYYLMERANPASKTEAWVLEIRRFIDFFILLYGSYLLLDSMAKIRKFSIMLLLASGICALYGCIEEWHGLFSWDMDHLMSDHHAFALMFVNGAFRKCGTLSNPAIFGLLMSACALYFLILAIYEKNKGLRALYLVSIILMVLAVGYSGTRTAYASMVIGLAFFILLNINQPVIKRVAIFSVLAFLLLMYGPGASFGPVRRFRTTFIGTEDQSYKVRLDARAFIQPFILSHPFGGGLGTTNGESDPNKRGDPLSGFQTDGAFVGRATETGYIGLALNLILYFMVMQLGIRGFFRSKDPQVKAYYSACLSAIFSLYLGEYAQAAIGGISDTLFYFPAIAIMLNLNEMEKARS